MTKFSLYHLNKKQESFGVVKSFKRWAPFLALIVFIFASGGIFYATETKICKHQPISTHSRRIITTTTTATTNQLVSTESIANMEQIFGNDTYDVDVYVNESLEAKSEKDISYWASVHFVATTITTIGYGDIVPCSEPGQVLAICFAFLGIPLMLVCLAEIGRWLEHALNRIWHWISNRRTFDSRQNYANDVPLSVGLAVTFVWILLSSIYFYFTLEPIYSKNNVTFTYFTACYFSVITFLTIGFGDISPLNYEAAIANYVVIFVGLALVTMCIDIMQTKVENMFDNVVTMIASEYKQNIVDENRSRKISIDKPHLKDDVQTMLKTTEGGTLFGAIMNKRQKNRLMEAYKKQASMVNKAVQATVDTIDHETHTEIKTEGVDVGLQAYCPVWQRRLPKTKTR